MGIDLTHYLQAGLLSVFQIDPAEMSPGEFAWRVSQGVRAQACKLVVIDSLNGYLAAMLQEKQLLLQIHELLAFLNQSGVATFLINPQFGLVGSMDSGPVNISYIADTVVLLRFFEAGGRIRKAISVLKNRGGKHEETIRELRIDGRGVQVGEPLVNFQGVLTGTPEFIGNIGAHPLLEGRHG